MNGIDCVFDTSVIIDYFQGDKNALLCLNRVESSGGSIHIGEITEIELLAFPGITPKEEAELKLFFEDVNIHPINSEIKNQIISLRRTTRRKLPDAIIAATAIFLHVPLITSDKALAGTDFPGLECRLSGDFAKE